MVTSETYQLP